MESPSPGGSLIRAQAEAIYEKVRDARVIGIRSPVAPGGLTSLTINGDRFDVATCRSTLEIREHLARVDGSDGRLIIVTPLQDTDIGEDVLARLARRRLFPLDAWEGAARLFKATRLDPRLRRESWLADALIDGAPPEGYAVAASGLLDRDTAWSAFLVYRLGLPDGRPDAVSLLRWTLTSDGDARYENLPSVFRTHLADRFAETAGPAGAAVADCAQAGYLTLAVPIGLALTGLLSEQVDTRVSSALREGAIRLERFTGGKRLEPRAMAEWAASAEVAATETSDPRLVRQIVDRADDVLDRVGVRSYAFVSNWSAVGLEQRLERYATALLDATAAQNVDTGPASAALAKVREHRLAAARPERLARAEMAMRVLRWLARDAQRSSALAPVSLDQMADLYRRDGSFVDLARISLRGGDPLERLADAYGRLLSRATDARERQNYQFGRALVDWVGTGSTSGGIVPVEDVLERIVAPLASEATVLLLVVDGMSLAVWHEVSDELSGLGWVPLRPERGQMVPGLAAIPSLTQISRTSLLSGALITGTSADEKRAFANHPQLVAVSKPHFAPVLFHKGEVAAAGGRSLAPEVRDAIGSGDRRIVGVVLNAVDDYLAKADQVRPRWTIEYIPLLDALLHEARAAGRIVVFASDHGHLLDDDTTLERSEAGDRWRADDGAVRDGEVVLAGPRVKGANGRVIVPWSERTRYGQRKNGYHGGATPQEMVVPLAVMSPGIQVAGWIETGIMYPAWWDDVAVAPAPAEPLRTTPLVAARAGESRVRRPAPLLEGLEQLVPEAAWIDRLFESRTYAAQKQMAGRGVPSDERMRVLLYALDQRGGKLTRTAVVHVLNMPLVRLAPFLAAARRILNVEGYGVLQVDETSDTIVLNRRLLDLQFELNR
jgi:hypothetical protein